MIKDCLENNFSLRRFEMNVREIMTSEVRTCSPENNLAEAAIIMWERDCGSVPVLDGNGLVVGMITDRDICMAVATRNKRASEIKVGEVIHGQVYSCSPDDKVKSAMQTMSNEQLRRLPVVDANGTLRGIISINDIVLHAKKGRSKKHIPRKDTMATLQALSAHRTNDSAKDQRQSETLAHSLSVEDDREGSEDDRQSEQPERHVEPQE
jgi:CBS domain-containing protein